MSEHRHSSGGAMFTLLLVLGFVVMFWWVFAIITGIVVLGIAGWLLARHLDARDAARDAITARPISNTHAYYYAELIGPNSSDVYTIRQSHNDCVPGCAQGTVTSRDLHWNGSDYVP
jgi:hypothetical protein